MSEEKIGRSKLGRGLACAVGGMLIALSCWGLGWLDKLEATTWDWRVVLLARFAPPTDQVRLILLDQASLDWAEEVQGIPWRWPRQLYGILLDFCRKSGVKALGFDLLFTEFSEHGVEDDHLFGLALKAYPHVAGAFFLGNSSGNAINWPADQPAPPLRLAGVEDWLARTPAANVTFARATMPIPEIMQAAAILCNVQQEPDPDGVYRRMRPFSLFDHHAFPSLGIGTYLAAQPALPLRIAPGQLTLGEQTIPLDRTGAALLRYRGPSGTIPFYSAAEILQAEIRSFHDEAPTPRDREIAQDLKDKYVLFGYSAPGLKDIRATPVGGVFSGVEINATMLENLLAGDFMRDSPWWVNLLLLALLTGTCGILSSQYSNPIQNVLVGGVYLAIPVVLALGWYLRGAWLLLILQELAVFITILSALMINYATEGKQKRFIKQAFKQYLSPDVIDRLIQDPKQLKLGGERRVLSMFFSDIQGFTSISEHLSPEDLTSLLNDFLSAMTEIIQTEGGTIDKYEGDAIIAFWNAPLNVPDHAVCAVRAALRCQAKLAELRTGFKQRAGTDVLMRVGINTGAVVVGNMGSHTRFNYTAFGDGMNLASRLEGGNKQFGSYIMISQFTATCWAMPSRCANWDALPWSGGKNLSPCMNRCSMSNTRHGRKS